MDDYNSLLLGPLSNNSKNLEPSIFCGGGKGHRENIGSLAIYYLWDVCIYRKYRGKLKAQYQAFLTQRLPHLQVKATMSCFSHNVKYFRPED